MTQKTVDSEVSLSVLTNHWRAILHMRQQIAARRFGLVLGAGVSKNSDSQIGPRSSRVLGLIQKYPALAFSRGPIPA